MSVIEITNLTREYGAGKGVFDLSFSVSEGEVFGFLGPNGAGKTTTIRHLMGFLKPQRGICTIGGLSCWDNSCDIQRDLGYIPGEIAFFDDMTGTDFIKFTASYRRIKANGRVKELMDRFELDAKGKIKKMSKGMKQKVGIVAAFMHDPKVLILDEPTSGLDPLMQSRFIELVIEERRRGKTILMSSHMFEEVERTCHRVSIIRNGKLVAMDSVDALKEAQVKRYVITLETGEQAIAFASDISANSALSGESTANKSLKTVEHSGIEMKALEINENKVTVTVRNNIKEFIAVMNRYPVTNISAPSQSLEEIFMQYYGGVIAESTEAEIAKDANTGKQNIGGDRNG